MTPREPDRYGAKAEKVAEEWTAGHVALVDVVAAALRAEHEETLERAARECDEEAHDEGNALALRERYADMGHRIRALASPAAAPAAEPDRVSRLLGRGHVENPREGEPGDAETYSEPVAPAPSDAEKRIAELEANETMLCTSEQAALLASEGCGRPAADGSIGDKKK